MALCATHYVPVLCETREGEGFCGDQQGCTKRLVAAGTQGTTWMTASASPPSGGRPRLVADHHWRTTHKEPTQPAQRSHWHTSAPSFLVYIYPPTHLYRQTGVVKSVCTNKVCVCCSPPSPMPCHVAVRFVLRSGFSLKFSFIRRFVRKIWSTWSAVIKAKHSCTGTCRRRDSPPQIVLSGGDRDAGDGAQLGVSLAHARALVVARSFVFFHTAIFRRLAS